MHFIHILAHSLALFLSLRKLLAHTQANNNNNNCSNNYNSKHTIHRFLFHFTLTHRNSFLCTPFFAVVVVGVGVGVGLRDCSATTTTMQTIYGKILFVVAAAFFRTLVCMFAALDLVIFMGFDLIWMLFTNGNIASWLRLRLEL